MIYMNERCKSILQMLLNQNSYLQPAQIAEILKVSKRSIYYDIYRINDWLSSYKISELETVRGKGILLSDLQKAAIEEALQDSSQEETYIYSPMERIPIIYCSILSKEKPIYIEQLMEYCDVSRNTVFNDLKVMETQLLNYDLKLRYEAKTGYYIAGDEIKIRAVFISYFNKLQVLYKRGNLKFFSREKIKVTLDTLKKIEKTLKIRYVEGILLSLAALFPIIERSEVTLDFADLKFDEIQSTLEYQLIDHYFETLKECEKIYLCLHLLGSRITVSSDDIFDVRPNQAVYETTKALVTEFEKVACVQFGDREKLEQALFVHINASLYRYQYGIQIGDEMCEDIMREYPDLFELTKLASGYLEQQVGLPIPDSEIAYLALHFGAHLAIPKTSETALRILIVCVNGVSTGNMIRREIQKLLPDAKIVGVESVTMVKNAQNQCDIIISTVKMKSVVPVIQVHPIITKQDRQTILNHPLIRNNNIRFNVNRLFSEIKPYVPPENWEMVEKKIYLCLNTESGDQNEYHAEKKKSLLDVLTVDLIKKKEEEEKWIPALWEAGEPLLEAGSIERKYLDQIISQIQFYGPYMFITPRVILAHAKPEDGVNALDVSMLLCKKEIAFSDFHKANVILILAAEDQENHLRMLKDIADVFSIQTRIDEILECGSPEEVREFICRIKQNQNKDL